MANTPLTRAEFLKILAAGSAGVLFLGGAEEALAGITGTNDALDQAALDGDARAAHAAGTVLAVAKGTSASSNVQRAIAAVGGMKKFVHSGDTVVIKPNICAARAPQYAATTNPQVVATLVRLAQGRRRRQGARDGQPHRQRSDRCLQRQRDRRRREGSRRLDAVHEQLGLQEVPAGRLSRQLPALRRHRERGRAHQRADREAAWIHRPHARGQEPHGVHHRPRSHAQRRPEPEHRSGERQSCGQISRSSTPCASSSATGPRAAVSPT